MEVFCWFWYFVGLIVGVVCLFLCQTPGCFLSPESLYWKFEEQKVAYFAVAINSKTTVVGLSRLSELKELEQQILLT